MPRERRQKFRVEWNSPATLYDRNGRRARPCVVSNFSNGGARICGVRPETIADQFLLRLSPHSRPRRCSVVWRTQEALGVEFTDDLLGMPREKARSTEEASAG